MATVLLTIRVQPQAGRQGLSLDSAGRLKAQLKSAPEQGKANKELVGLIADMLGIAKGRVSIALGETARTKRVAVEINCTEQELIAKLLGQKQATLF